MRKQIAAANWKMNLTLQKAEELLNELLKENVEPLVGGEVVLAVPFPYLQMAAQKINGRNGYVIAAQNCSNKKAGAYTGEVSVEMLHSMGIRHCLIGHSERREYYHESNQLLAEKINLCLEQGLTPIFCCGEALEIREKNEQNDFVKTQLQESLFHLNAAAVQKIVVAYEPVWAIGTGKTASTQEAQQMHQFIRSVLAEKWGLEVANGISILYGGSVKASNAKELFSCTDVDGGLVGGASLSAPEFIQIIKALSNKTL